MISFVVPGPPVPKLRPRVMLIRGKPVAVEKDHFKAWKKHVGFCAMAACSGRDVSYDAHAQAFRVRLRFFMPTRRPCDVDNLVGGVLDGLNGIAWKDDSSVVELAATRRLDRERPRVEVDLESHYVDPWEGVLP